VPLEATATGTSDRKQAIHAAADNHSAITTSESLKKISRSKNIFAIVADPRMHRKYPWGTCDVMDVHHSDFPLLREQLFQYNTMKSMIEATRDRTGKMMMRRKLAAKEAEKEASAEAAVPVPEPVPAVPVPVVLSPSNTLWKIAVAILMLALLIAFLRGQGLGFLKDQLVDTCSDADEPVLPKTAKRCTSTIRL
jgi:hypothetical protein